MSTNGNHFAATDQHNSIEAIQSSSPEILSHIGGRPRIPPADQLLTPDDVAARLNVSKDWVWDHSSRKAPYLPVIRLADGTLRYRASKIEEFIEERERLSCLRRKKVK